MLPMSPPQPPNPPPRRPKTPIEPSASAIPAPPGLLAATPNRRRSIGTVSIQSPFQSPAPISAARPDSPATSPETASRRPFGVHRRRTASLPNVRIRCCHICDCFVESLRTRSRCTASTTFPPLEFCLQYLSAPLNTFSARDVHIKLLHGCCIIVAGVPGPDRVRSPCAADSRRSHLRS